YPFASEIGVFANNFSHVYVDACFLPLISPTMTRETLSEWLELIPSNKILWGGDCRSVEMAYGAILYIRELLLEVLSEKIQRTYFDEDEALEIALKILRENAIELYGL
ncbi:MAG: hypothetical protein GTN39_03670, partial [Candidatus Aenigmarchaeota archaeon]|nr:hypothetical protein [Candidatus Aenigmarchaeota archaeon]